MKNIRVFFGEKIAIFLVVKCSVYLNRRVFVMYRDIHYFSFSVQKHRMWVLVRTGGFNEYPQSMF